MDTVDFNCIFCAIAARRAPAALIYENEHALAFLDLHPIVEGHTLIIPREHARNLFDFDDASGQGVMRAARIVARAVRATYNADGMNLFQSSERAAGQDVFHFHFHPVPRFANDGLMGTRDGGERITRWRARGNPARAELDAIAAHIRAHIATG